MINYVVYDNRLNNFGLRGLSITEMHLFWTMINKIKDMGEGELIFTRKEISELSEYDTSNRTIEQFKQDMRSMKSKLFQLNTGLYDPKNEEEVYFTLFPVFKITNNKITIKVSEYFIPWFNLITEEFTKFDLKNILNLSSSYSKELYRFLMKNKTFGHAYGRKNQYPGLWEVTIEDFRELMCIPKSYQIGHIIDRVINTSKQEFLAIDKDGYSIFEHFDVIYIKKGRITTKLKFIYKISEPKEKFIEQQNYIENKSISKFKNVDEMNTEEMKEYIKFLQQSNFKEHVEKLNMKQDYELEKKERKKRGHKNHLKSEQNKKDYGNKKYKEGYNDRDKEINNKK